MKVRAALATTPHAALEIVTLDLAEPGPGEVLVKMIATGLCRSDLSILEGKEPQFPFPIILGHEGAGIVVECGTGVTSVQPGDHVVTVGVPECRQCKNCTSHKTNVCLEIFNPPPPRFSYRGDPVQSFGGVAAFAEYSVIGEIRLAKIRKDVPLEVVCYIGCGVMTGIGSALRTAEVTAGSSVAVFGLGGIGLNVLQGARIAGAGAIIGIDTNSARESIARNFGATDFLNPRQVKDLLPRIHALTGGGVDFSFECVGDTEVMRTALESTNPAWGVTVQVGLPGAGATLSFDPASFLMGRTWKGSMLGGGSTRSTVPQLVDWYKSGFLRLDELITHRISLTEINHGFDMMKSGEAVRSVIVF